MKILITGHRGFIGSHLWPAVQEQFPAPMLYGLDRKDGNDILSCELPEVGLVFHLAAQTDAFNRDMRQNVVDNISGTTRILERYGNRVVHASTSMVNYPVNPYAITKRAAENMALYYGAQVVRLCNIFGDGGHSVIDKFRGSSVLTIYGDGSQLRTYAPVEKAVGALLRASDRIHTGEAKLDILRGDNMSVNEVALAFPGRHREYAPARLGDILNGVQQ